MRRVMLKSVYVYKIQSDNPYSKLKMKSRFGISEFRKLREHMKSYLFTIRSSKNSIKIKIYI